MKMKQENENFVKFSVWKNCPLLGWDLCKSLENIKLVHVDSVGWFFVLSTALYAIVAAED